MAGPWEVNFEPVQNALGAWQKRQQFDAEKELQRERMAQQDKQWGASNALAQEKFAEGKRQFGMNYGLREKEATESARRFDINYKLQKDQFGLQREEADRKKEAALLGHVGGLAQMIDNEQDPAKRQQMWQKLYGANPGVGRIFSQYGVDPADHINGPRAVQAIVRGYKDDPALSYQKTKEGETIHILNRRGQKVGTLASPADPKLGPYKTMKDRAGVEEGLRKEYASLAKPYFETRDAWTRVQQSAKSPSPAGDLSLIFNYMKMLDPGSVVREGEFATAQNAAGVPERVQAMYNRAISGERLTDSIRQDFVKQARGLFSKAERQYQSIQKQYKGISNRVGVDPNNTIVDFTQPQDGPQPGPAVRVTTPDEARRLPSGTRILLPDGTEGVVP